MSLEESEQLRKRFSDIAKQAQAYFEVGGE